jgi:hypothetical protein
VEPQIDETAFRTGWLVRSRAAALFENNEIDGRQYQAVLWWRRAVERLGRVPGQQWLTRVDGSHPPGAGVGEAELAAAAALRSSSWALGQRRVALLLAAVIQDRSWHDIGKQLGVSHKTAKVRVIEAIGALARWKAGETVPPAPLERFRNQPGSW